MKNYRPNSLSLLLLLTLSLLYVQGSALTEIRTINPRTDGSSEQYTVGAKTQLSETSPAIVGDTTEWPFPCDKNSIERYTAYQTTKPLVIDGQLDEEIWAKIPRSPRFVDLVSGTKTIHDTRAAVCWDKDNLYLAFWVEEPFITAKLTNQNDPIYTDNDVEVFIAGKDSYYEFEINALGTRYEAFFIWKEGYEKGGFHANPLFATANPNVKQFNGVGFKNHPRGLRYGAWDFRFPALRSGVHIDGTINDNRDRDRMWTVELAFPWKGMDWIAKADNRAFPPRHNDQWRIDFSRFNTYKEALPANDHGGWAWNPHRVWDSHLPECFPVITFSAKTL